VFDLADRQALWVFPDIMSTPMMPVDPRDEPNVIADVSLGGQRDQLIARSAACGVDILYLSVFHSPGNEAGRLMHEEDYIADLITKAHAKGIEVWAAYGARDWPDANLG